MPEGLRIAQKEDARGKARRAVGFLLSGEEFLGAATGGRYEGAISRLPSRVQRPVRFAVENIASPLGLAALAAAPFTGGTSLGLRAAATATKPGFARAGLQAAGFGTQLATRTGAELGIIGAGTKVAEQVSEFVPEDAPAYMQIGAPLLGAIAVGGGASAVLNSGKRATAASARAAVLQSQRDLAATANTTFAMPLAPIERYLEEIVAFPDSGPVNKAKRALLGSTGINPSVLNDHPIGKANIAYQMLRAQADDNAFAAVSHALPNKFKSFRINKDGTVGNTGLLLDDMLAFPDAPKRFGFTPAQTEEFTNLHTLMDDYRGLLKFYKLPAYAGGLLPNGRLYLPRQATGVSRDDMYREFRRPSNPDLERFYDDLVEGKAAGVDYADLPTALGYHFRRVYNLIAEKQFADAVEPLTVTPTKAFLASKGGKAAYARRLDAIKEYNLARDKVHNLQQEVFELTQQESALRVAGQTTRANNMLTSLDAAKARLATVHSEMVAADSTRIAERASYKAKFARYETGNIEALPANLFGRGTGESIPVDMWKHRFIPSDDFKRIDEWFDRNGIPRVEKFGRAFNVARAGNDLARLFAATLDAAMPFIQGLPLLAADPVAWSKMLVRHYQAMLSPGTLRRYMAVEENALAANEMINLGRVGIANPEFLEVGLIAGAPSRRILRLPGFKQSAAAYETGLTVARVEMWKSMRPFWKGTPAELGQHIRNMTGGLESVTLGVPSRQRAIESMTLFSPRLLRSTIALSLDALKVGTPEGDAALHALLRLSSAATVTAVVANMAVGLGLGETEEEIQARVLATVNPLEGKKFLSVQGPNGDWYGIGGQVRAVSQFAASVMAGRANESVADNPITRYVTGRMSPAAAFGLSAAELATGERLNLLPFEFVDKPLDVTEMIGTSMLPFAVQGLLEGQNIDTTIIGALGLRTSAMNPSEELNRKAKEAYGVDYRDLTGKQQEELGKANPDIIEKKKEFGSLAEHQHREAIQEIEATYLDSQEKLVQGIRDGRFSRREKFRDALEDAKAARFAKRRQADEDFGIEFGPSDSPKRKVLDAYYQTFQDAEFSPGQVDWLKWNELQSDLQARIDSGEFGNPLVAQKYIDERRTAAVAPELAWYFENDEVIREAGYWDIRSVVFEQFLPRLQAAGLDVKNVTELDRLIAQGGDQAALAQRFARRIDALAGDRRKALRARNPGLDLALLENGWVTVPASRATKGVPLRP